MYFFCKSIWCCSINPTSSALSIEQNLPQKDFLFHSLEIPHQDSFYAALWFASTSIHWERALLISFGRLDSHLCFCLDQLQSSQLITHIKTLQGAEIETVECYKYLGLWLDTSLTFRTHVEQLSNKLKVKIGFLYRNKSCFSSSC